MARNGVQGRSVKDLLKYLQYSNKDANASQQRINRLKCDATKAGEKCIACSEPTWGLHSSTPGEGVGLPFAACPWCTAAHEGVELLHTTNKGIGLFSARRFAKGETVALYSSNLRIDGTWIGDRHVPEGADTYDVRVNSHDGCVRPQNPQDWGRYLNHACGGPPCNVVIEFRNKKGEKASDAEEVHSIALITKTDVGMGRELCWWYGCTDGDAMKCKCGWEGCQGMVHL